MRDLKELLRDPTLAKKSTARTKTRTPTATRGESLGDTQDHDGSSEVTGIGQALIALIWQQTTRREVPVGANPHAHIS